MNNLFVNHELIHNEVEFFFFIYNNILEILNYILKKIKFIIIFSPISITLLNKHQTPGSSNKVSRVK